MIAAAVSSFSVNNKDEVKEGEADRSFSIMAGDDISDFILDVSIDFDDLFMGINEDDVLPDLEFDPDLLADFSPQFSGLDEEDDKGSSDYCRGEESPAAAAGEKVNESSPPPPPKVRSRVSTNSKNSCNGKRKVKVDWNPELHRRFVQAVEQLGVDKAVPSRILDLMGIDCLTRHNIASHLQKYRSHRKHLLAREAEATNWNQRRQLGKNMTPWPLAPTMGFPPMAGAAPPSSMHHFRPLHVWGQPSTNQSMLMHMWPKQIPPSPSPPPNTAGAIAWSSSPARPHIDSSFWHAHQYQRAPGTPCFPAKVSPPTAMATTRFSAPTVPGIPHHLHLHHHPVPMYRPPVDAAAMAAASSNPPADFHPSKESIDAALGDALTKPWLPLPIGLKSPSLDSVMDQLEQNGVPKIPLACV